MDNDFQLFVMLHTLAHFKGSIYPDRTFSIGYVPRKQLKAEDKEYERELEDEWDWYDYEVKKYGCKYKKIHRFFSQSRMPSRFIKCSQSSQKPKPKTRYGLNGITKKGKKTTSNCAILLEQKYGKSRIGFVTCTLPGYDSDALQVIARDWNNIVRKFFQQVRRDLKKQNAPLEYVSVTEIQEKRWKKTGGIALHLHFAYVAKPPNKKGFYILSQRFREVWERIINKSLEKAGLLHGCNQKSFSASIDCVIVKKSVAGYLGKYISKGCKVVEEVVEKGKQDGLPGQWWTASMQLKLRLKKKIIPINREIANLFMFCIDRLVEEKSIESYCDVYCEFNEEEYRIGMSGKVSKNYYHEFAKLLVRNYEEWIEV